MPECFLLNKLFLGDLPCIIHFEQLFYQTNVTIASGITAVENAVMLRERWFQKACTKGVLERLRERSIFEAENLNVTGHRDAWQRGEEGMEYYILNNGIKMPALGIGTYLLAPADAEKSVSIALACGFNLIDTANAYCNERAVGRAIRSSEIARQDIFVSTKLWPSEYENNCAVDETLERLGLDYIDLLFLHQPAGNWRAGYRQLEKAYQDGKIKSIGISNFEGNYIDELLSYCEMKPQVMQVECHPYYPQTGLRALIDTHGIKIMSWYPLGGKGNTQKLLGEQIIRAIADKYGKTPAQIVLRWHIDMKFIVIPGSKNKSHIQDNSAIWDFKLNAEDMKEIASLNTESRFYVRTDAALKGLAAWRPIYEKN